MDSGPPPAPVLTDTDPESPSGQNTVHVKGTSAAGTTVRIYTDPACTGGAFAAGPAATFASPGLEVTVGDESETTFYASGLPPPCSTSSLSYTEDSTPPNTTIPRGMPSRVGKRRARFVFTSPEADVSFQCALDDRDFVFCDTPWLTPRLAKGKHSLQVRAVDAAGNPDESPARRRFRIGRR